MVIDDSAVEGRILVIGRRRSVGPLPEHLGTCPGHFQILSRLIASDRNEGITGAFDFPRQSRFQVIPPAIEVERSLVPFFINFGRFFGVPHPVSASLVVKVS